MYFLLQYDYVQDILERRAPFREGHLAMARASNASGSLVMAGALADPVDSAVFVFRGEDASAIEEFVKNDPYVLNGLVPRWRIRPWNVVIGG